MYCMSGRPPPVRHQLWYDNNNTDIKSNRKSAHNKTHTPFITKHTTDFLSSIHHFCVIEIKSNRKSPHNKMHTPFTKQYTTDFLSSNHYFVIDVKCGIRISSRGSFLNSFSLLLLRRVSISICPYFYRASTSASIRVLSESKYPAPAQRLQTQRLLASLSQCRAHL